MSDRRHSVADRQRTEDRQDTDLKRQAGLVRVTAEKLRLSCKGEVWWRLLILAIPRGCTSRGQMSDRRFSMKIRRAPPAVAGRSERCQVLLPGCCKLIFAPPEKIESCTVSTPSLEVPGATSNDTTA
jgi:hypothetical protein